MNFFGNRYEILKRNLELQEELRLATFDAHRKARKQLEDWQRHWEINQYLKIICGKESGTIQPFEITPDYKERLERFKKASSYREHINKISEEYNLELKEKKMKTLSEHNLERQQQVTKSYSNDPIKNGIKCPTCSSELIDTSPQITLSNRPPQKNIHCSACGYFGYRLA